MTAESAAGRRRRIGIIGVCVAVSAALLTSSCAAGRDAQTAHVKTSLDGTNVTLGDMALRGLSIEAPSGNPYYLPGSDARVNLVLVNTGDTPDRLIGLRTSAARTWGAFDTVDQADVIHAAANASVSAAARLSPVAAATETGSTPASKSSTSSTSPSSASSQPPSPTASSSMPPLPSGSRSVLVPAGSRVSWGVPDATGGLLLIGTRGKLYPGESLSVTFTFARAGSITAQVPLQLTSSPGTETVGGLDATNADG